MRCSFKFLGPFFVIIYVTFCSDGPSDITGRATSELENFGLNFKICTYVYWNFITILYISEDCGILLLNVGKALKAQKAQKAQKFKLFNFVIRCRYCYLTI